MICICNYILVLHNISHAIWNEQQSWIVLRLPLQLFYRLKQVLMVFKNLPSTYLNKIATEIMWQLRSWNTFSGGIYLRLMKDHSQNAIFVSKSMVYRNKNRFVVLWLTYHHTIDCFYNLKHFISCDVSIFVKVVKTKCP